MVGLLKEGKKVRMEYGPWMNTTSSELLQKKNDGQSSSGTITKGRTVGRQDNNMIGGPVMLREELHV